MAPSPGRPRSLRADVASDLQAQGEYECSWLRLSRLLILNPGLLCSTLLRLQQSMHRRPATRRLALLVRSLNHLITGADFYPGCEIGPGLLIAHPNGIVVGRGAVIGRNGFLCQRVTLGQRLGAQTEHYPVLGDDVLVGTGATVLGAVLVGSGARIGAGAVVLQDVPANSTVAGNPARVVRHRGTAGIHAVAGDSVAHDLSDASADRR